MDTATYLHLLRGARRRSRRPEEAEDLLQSALAAALEARRGDLTAPENRRWLLGVIRNRALHEARTAVRRRRRDGEWQAEAPPHAGLAPDADEAAPCEDLAGFAARLPPGQRAVALLAFTGHAKGEIAWLLGLSDAALRQRLSQIRRRWRAEGFSGPPRRVALAGDLAFGRLRAALLPRVRQAGDALGSHDPDGHLFVVASQKADARQQSHVRA